MTEKLSGLVVLCCRGDRAVSGVPVAEYDDLPTDLLISDIGPILGACRPAPVHLVGPRPGKAIDPLLTGRVLVVGDDADLNAVVLRLLRKERLAAVAVAYAPSGQTALTGLYDLPVGVEAVAAAAGSGAARPAPLARSDAGGVLVGRAELTAVTAPFYVDAHRIPAGRPALVQVHPDDEHGLAVSATRPGPWRIGRRTQAYSGRAVEFGIVSGGGTTITFDGIRHPRDVNRWVFYRHTEPLLLVRR